MNNIIDNTEFGEKMEMEILPKIQEYFKDPTIRRNPNKKSVLDYQGKKSRELKSRRLPSFQYDTTLLPINKIEMTKHLDKDFLFLFDNALGYISYDHERFSKYKTKMVFGHHFDGDYEVECFLIPISDLTWIYKKCLLL